MRQSVQVLSLLTTTLSASLATTSGLYWMLFDWQTAISLSLIGRDASEMSVSPAQNFSNPPPVPEVPTVTLASGCSPMNSSAAAEDSGSTVLDPSITTGPEMDSPSPPPVLSLPPHAARVNPAATATAATRVRWKWRMVTEVPPAYVPTQRRNRCAHDRGTPLSKPPNLNGR